MWARQVVAGGDDCSGGASAQAHKQLATQLPEHGTQGCGAEGNKLGRLRRGGAVARLGEAASAAVLEEGAHVRGAHERKVLPAGIKKLIKQVREPPRTEHQRSGSCARGSHMHMRE